jgi:prepilin-type N-terminal cleavage/methylation domain-containing protein
MFKKNSIKKTKNSAFSLIELSIVIFIIGILIIGATQGYSLVKSAQISNARGLTAKSPISQIQGLIAWYETSLKESINLTEIKEGANISAWKDVSPSSIINGNNKLTAVASSNITYSQSGINKIPSIKFTGSSNLSITNFSQGSSSQATIFLVIKPNYAPDSTNFKTIFDGKSTSFSFSIKSDMIQLNAGTAASSASFANSFANSGEYIIATYFNGSNSKVYINSDSPIGGSSINPGSNQITGITIGTNMSGASGFSGFISEVVIFNRVIKNAERKEIFNYLSKKYKISIN